MDSATLSRILKPSLTKLIRNLQRNEGGIYIPYIADEHGLDKVELCKAITQEFPNGVYTDTLYSIEPPNELWYYEICDSLYVRGCTLRSDLLVANYKNNVRADQHVSTFAKDHKWVRQIRTKDTLKQQPNSRVKIHSLWIELDRKYEGGYNKALEDAMVWYNNFPYPESARLWTSGNQSIHIEIDAGLFGYPQGWAKDLCGRDRAIYRLAVEVFGNIRHPHLDLLDPWTEDHTKMQDEYRKLGRGEPHEQFKQELENIDPNIYGFNSLIRAPLSIHEKTMRQKKIVHGPDKLTNPGPKLAWMYMNVLLRPRKTKKVVECGADTTYIIQEYLDIDGFDPDDADSTGWVNKLYNPFYEDTAPSLSVNIEDGRFYDFGNPDYRFGFVKYLMTKYDLTGIEAKQLIEDNTERENNE